MVSADTANEVVNHVKEVICETAGEAAAEEKKDGRCGGNRSS